MREPRIKRLSVLLHAAPFQTQHAQFEDADVAALSGAVASLLEQRRPESIRLAIFNLDQGAVYYRSDDFRSTDLDRARAVLVKARFAVVDSKAQQSAGGPVHMASDLLGRELANFQSADAIVFLGPYAPLAPGRFNAFPTATAADARRLYYLQFRNPPHAPRLQVEGDVASPFGRPAMRLPRDPVMYPDLGPPRLPDAITLLMKAAKGDTAIVYSPHDLASAMQRILTRAGGI